MKTGSSPIILMLLCGVLIASCGSTRSTGSKYPYPGSPYPYPRTERPYPGSYPNDRYPEYGSRYPSRIPPGQAKKIYGGKSARVYAPGQQKKYGAYGRRDHRYNKGTYNKKRNRYDDDREN